jgi:hypothetical protein
MTGLFHQQSRKMRSKKEQDVRNDMQEENNKGKEQITSHHASPSRVPMFDPIRGKLVEVVEKWYIEDAEVR